MRTVWAWQVVQGSRNSEWLLIHFPAMREGQVYYLHNGYGETDENMASGKPEKKMLLVSTKQEIRTKTCYLLHCDIELRTNLV